MTQPSEGGDRPARPGPFQARRWWPLALLIAGLVLFFALGGERYLSWAMLRASRTELVAFVAAHPLAAPLVYLVAYTAMTAFSVPEGAVATVLGGFLFGPVLATVYVVFAATLGATLLFLAARTSLGAVFAAKAGPSLHKMEAGFQAQALSYLLFLRLVPVFPFWLVNLVSALLNVPLGTYVLGTFLGIIPGTFVFALAGNGVAEVLESGRTPALDDFTRAAVLLPLIGLALLALVPVAYKAVTARKR